MKTPNPLTAAKSAVGLVKNLVQGKPVLVEEEELEKRLGQCDSCEFKDPISNQCKQCSCFIFLKTQFKHETCPVGKW